MALGVGIQLVQVAVVSALTTAGLTVYDQVPENAAGPYVAVGDQDSERKFPTFGRDGRMLDFVLRVWSQNFGWAEAMGIASTVINTLDNVPLTLSTGVNSWILFNTLTRQRDPDGIWRQAILHFDLQLEA